MKTRFASNLLITSAMVLLVSPCFAVELPDPDGKPADMSKPVKV